MLKIVYLKPLKNFTYSKQDKLSPVKKTKMKSFEGKFRNLNFLPSTKETTEYSFELFLSIYRNSFSIATMVMRFPAKKNAGCPKAPRDFPPRKDGILVPRQVALGLPSHSPPPDSVGTYVR